MIDFIFTIVFCVFALMEYKSLGMDSLLLLLLLAIIWLINLCKQEKDYLSKKNNDVKQ